jgi:protoporphyrinogen oxidase
MSSPISTFNSQLFVMRVCIIGAGISGLTTAFLLKQKGVAVTVLERSDTPGGNIQTIEKDGFTIEQGPNSLLKSPRLVDLVRLLGIEDKVIPANESAKKRYILAGGELEAMGPKSFVNGYFSLKTVLSRPKRNRAPNSSRGGSAASSSKKR